MIKQQDLFCLLEIKVCHKWHTISKLQPLKLEIKLLILMTIVWERKQYIPMPQLDNTIYKYSKILSFLGLGIVLCSFTLPLLHKTACSAPHTETLLCSETATKSIWFQAGLSHSCLGYYRGCNTAVHSPDHIRLKSFGKSSCYRMGSLPGSPQRNTAMRQALPMTLGRKA